VQQEPRLCGRAASQRDGFRSSMKPRRRSGGCFIEPNQKQLRDNPLGVGEPVKGHSRPHRPVERYGTAQNTDEQRLEGEQQCRPLQAAREDTKTC
jgi:hypothetical protein